jgi:hypothetical protein
MNYAEKFLASIGWDYKNTESAARMVAEKAQERIESLTAEVSRLRTIAVVTGTCCGCGQRFIYDEEHTECPVCALRTLMSEAIETIKVFHGPDAWDIYYNNAPEMKRFRDAASGRE